MFVEGLFEQDVGLEFNLRLRWWLGYRDCFLVIFYLFLKIRDILEEIEFKKVLNNGC